MNFVNRFSSRTNVKMENFISTLLAEKNPRLKNTFLVLCACLQNPEFVYVGLGKVSPGAFPANR